MSSTTRTAATAAASPDTAGGRTSRRTIGGRDLRSILLEGRAFIALIVLIIVFSMLSDVFLSSTNLITMTKHVAYNAILALGMLFVVLKGGIDLSVGSVVGLSGMVAGFLLGGWQLDAFGVVMYPPVWVVVLAGVLVGMFVGLVNGVLVAKLGVAPFIATLGTLYMARGAALLISDGATFPRLGGDPALGNTGFLWLGGGRILGIPNSIWVMVGVATVAVFILRKTPFGRWIYSIGGNERAAELAGVPVARVKILAYVISGAAGLGDQVTIAGFDGSPDAVQAIKDGKLLATGLQPAVLISELAVEQADQYIRTGDTGQPEKQSIDCILIDATNADQYTLFALQG